MTFYNKVNNAVGWMVFVFATGVYMLTTEPTGSFWDCGEFLPSAYKLQLSHSPGAPLFAILGRLFMMLASTPEKAPLMMNYMCNIMTGFAALFGFWTITSIGLKMMKKKETDLTMGEIMAVMAAGVVGAASITFLDSVWFSAVEAIVWAGSTFFTALIFWCIMKWDHHADEPYADRWLVLIGYIIGLSIGVHLLNLLTIPAMTFVYYFRKTKNVTPFGVIATFFIGVIILGTVQYGIIQQIPNMAANFDIFFVNTLGLPFDSGAIFWLLMVLAAILGGFYYAFKNKYYYLHTALLTVSCIIIGYSSYCMVLIRANAEPSINMSDPKDPIDLVPYLSREQYGDRPLAFGQYFTAKVVDVDFKNGEMKYWRGEKKYEELGRKPIVKYDPEDETVFPRAWDGDDPGHARFYRDWLNLAEGQKPTFGQNIKFFATYQVGWMYWRYFLWNFAGRQNDIQGIGGDVQHGNWISGINLIDDARLGPQENLPSSMADNKGKNKFYFLPLILGLIGVFFSFNRSKLDAWIMMLFFLFTGMAILIYLNQTPMQPRERDYSYAVSFYAFCLFIGMGVIAIYELLKDKMDSKIAAIVAFAVCLVVPGIMGAQGWDDHDRSHRYTARDFGRDYLVSCPKNAILFTQGDNDTYPLWYVQEVEGIRPDVRVVNLSLLGVDWYIDNLRRMVNESDTLPITIPAIAYRGSNHDAVRYSQSPSIDQNQYYDAKDVVDFMVSNDPRKKGMIYGELNNYLPAKNLYINVDKDACIKNGFVDPKDSARIPSRIEWKMNKSVLLKPDIMVLDIIAHANWKRPVCFAVSASSDAFLGLGDYLEQDGLIYRLVPIKQSFGDGLPGGINTKIMYDNVMHKFAWGGIDKFNVYLDENILRMVSNLRSNFARLANALVKEGDNKKAVEVLDRCMQVLPEKNVPYSLFSLPVAQAYYKAGANDKGKGLVLKLVGVYSDNLRYIASLNEDYRSNYKRDINEALYVISQVDELSKTYKDDQLNKQVEPILKEYSSLYTPDNNQQQDDN